MLSAILFVVVMILLLASWAVYIGVFIKGVCDDDICDRLLTHSLSFPQCCSDGCSVDGGYSCKCQSWMAGILLTFS